MAGRYEVEGTLEGNQLIRLREPLPCKEGPVKVIVTPQTEETGRGDGNRGALDALENLLEQPDDLTPGQWAELEKVIEEHPLRIRRTVEHSVATPSAKGDCPTPSRACPREIHAAWR